MNTIYPGTVLITGPTSGLGKSATLAMASRPAAQRPDLLLVGRPGAALREVAEQARAEGRSPTRSVATSPDWPTFAAPQPRPKGCSQPGRFAHYARWWRTPV